MEDSPDQVEADIEEDLTSEIQNLDRDQKDTFKRGDLYKMHTYRDALLGSRGAYILFPGSGEDEEIFIRHPGSRYPSAPYHFPSVGAFQLRPYENAGQRNNLEEFLTTVLDQIITTKQYQEEEGRFT